MNGFSKGIGIYPENKGIEILGEAEACWNAWGHFRKERQRCKRYTYGDQWEDTIEVGGRTVTEKEYIMEQGNLPLKNNLIRRLVRNLLGVWRNNRPPLSWPLPEMDRNKRKKYLSLLRESSSYNNLDEIMSRCLEEFLISGLTVIKKGIGGRNGRKGPVTFIVQPDKFFMDPCSVDPRGWDAGITGEIHDVDFKAICATFGHNVRDYSSLLQIYAPEASHAPTDGDTKVFGGNKENDEIFHIAGAGGKCRVIEVWRRETMIHYLCHDSLTGEVFKTDPSSVFLLEKINRIRRTQSMPEIKHIPRTSEVWRYYFLSPQGHILDSGDSPWLHGGHPYVFKAYPFIDGEIHSFVGDIIDQQRYANRLISLYDWIMRASAKGVLLFPEDALPEGVDINDISDEWSRFNGVILFSPKANSPLPQQVSSKATNIGITELLDIQMKMMEDISGVNSALQGKLANNSMSGSLFDQQTRNALSAVADILDSFESFVTDSMKMEASNILRQFTS